MAVPGGDNKINRYGIYKPYLKWATAMSIHDVIDLDFSSDLPEVQTPVAAPPQAYPSINPLLVNLYDVHKKYGESSYSNEETRQQICQQMIDLMSVSPRVSDREMITDVLITLLRQSERDLKEAMAERLSEIEQVPLRLLLQFVNDDISIAEPILKNSVVLNDLDLLYIIQSRDTTFWQVIAQRHRLAGNVVDALADTHDVPTAKCLVANDTVSLTDYATHIFCDMAQGNPDLAQPLLLRDDVPVDVAKQLYSFVGQEIRKMVARKYHFDDAVITDAVDDVVDEFKNHDPQSATSGLVPTASMVRAAELFLKSGKLSPVLMIRTLKRGQVASFVAQFSVFAGLPVAVIVLMLQQSSGQGLAIASKASGLPKEAFQAIFVLSRRFIGQQNDIDSKSLKQAISYYERVSPEMAKRVIHRSRQ